MKEGGANDSTDILHLDTDFDSTFLAGKAEREICGLYSLFPQVGIDVQNHATFSWN